MPSLALLKAPFTRNMKQIALTHSKHNSGDAEMKLLEEAIQDLPLRSFRLET
jgi:hypothetical protein